MKKSHKFGQNLRADSAWILYQVLEEGRSTRELFIPVLERYSSAKDKNWINETVLGVLRNLPTLQIWLRPKLQKPLKGSKKIVEHVLLIGLYQLGFMRVSAHAAINETVNACTLFNAHGLKGLVNAILRDIQRSPPAIPEDPQIASGLPKWIYNTVKQAYPNDCDNVIENMNSKAPIWLRVNTQEVEFERFCSLLIDQGIQFQQPTQRENALIIENCSVTELPGYAEGFFAVQDGAAQKAAVLLNPQNNEKVLDCCTAPGGKACHLYTLAPNAHITAVDADEKRLLRVKENQERLKCNFNIVHGDGAKPESWWDGEQFDRILLDAPCSATGVIRRHPDIRWLRKPADIDTLVTLQADILSAIWPLLKPGGTLLYATCSILPKENCEQINSFVDNNSDATRNMDDIQILPGQEQMDGFYYARLVKSNG